MQELSEDGPSALSKSPKKYINTYKAQLLKKIRGDNKSKVQKE